MIALRPPRSTNPKTIKATEGGEGTAEVVVKRCQVSNCGGAPVAEGSQNITLIAPGTTSELG